MDRKTPHDPADCGVCAGELCSACSCEHDAGRGQPCDHGCPDFVSLAADPDHGRED